MSSEKFLGRLRGELVRFARGGLTRGISVVTGISIVIIIMLVVEISGTATTHAVSGSLVDLAVLTLLLKLVISISPAPLWCGVSPSTHTVAVGLVDLGLLDVGLLASNHPFAASVFPSSHAISRSLVDFADLLRRLIHVPVALLVLSPCARPGVAAALTAVVDAGILVCGSTWRSVGGSVMDVEVLVLATAVGVDICDGLQGLLDVLNGSQDTVLALEVTSKRVGTSRLWRMALVYWGLVCHGEVGTRGRASSVDNGTSGWGRRLILGESQYSSIMSGPVHSDKELAANLPRQYHSQSASLAPSGA